MTDYRKLFEEETGEDFSCPMALYPQAQQLDRYSKWLERKLSSAHDALRWRSVAKGELPEKSGEYNVIAKDEDGSIKTSSSYTGYKWWIESDGYEVTHWLSIPPISEEGK